MKQPLLLGLVVLFGLLAVVAGAQQLKVKEDRGHLSPVRATLTFTNDKTRDVVIAAMGGKYRTNSVEEFYTHVFFVRTDAGVSKRTLWIDEIAAIRGLNTLRTSSSEFKITMKNGSSLDAMFVPQGRCEAFKEFDRDSNPCSALLIQDVDGSEERIDMRDLKAVEFKPGARKDKLDNFMFDVWRFSPFTGEKLP